MATMLDAVINLKDNFSNTLKQVEKTVGDFSRTAQRMGKDIQNTGKSVSKVGGNLTKSLTLPLVGLGATAIKIGMEFEQGMSNVKAVTGATGEEMKLLEKAARDAGKATSKSATEASEALGYMGLAGWSVKDSMDGLMPILRLSEAGNIDLGRASDLVTDSMSAMGVEVKDLPKYLDIVAQTARSSNTDIDAMMEAYLGVGGVLRGLKVPIEDSAVSLGMLANAGIKGAEGGKSLSSILTNLTAPTGRAKKALDELGFSAFDGQGNFKGMENVLFDLKDKMKGMTTEEQNMYMSMIAGKEHIKGLNALMNGLGDGYDELKGKVNNSKDALDEMAKTMLDNNKGSITQLKSALEELGLKVYDILKPKIAAITKTIQKFVDKLNDMSPAMQEKAVKFAMMAAAIGPVLMVIGKLTTFVGGAILKFGKFAGVVKSLGLKAAIFTPGVQVVAIIAAIIAVGVLLWKNWDKIKAKAEDIFPGIGAGISNAISTIRGHITGFITWITPYFKVGIEMLKQVISSGLEFIKQFWATHGETIIEVVSTYLEILKIVWGTAFKIIKKVVMVAVGFIQMIWSVFGETLISYAKNIWAQISGVIGGALKVIKGIFNIVLGVITGDWNKAWEGVKQVFSGIFDAIVAVVKGKINAVKIIISGTIGKIASVIGNWFTQTLPNTIRSGVDKVVEFFTALPEKIAYGIGYAIGYISTLPERATLYFTEMKDKAVEKTSELIESVTTYISELPVRISTFFTNAKESAVTIATELVEGVVNFIQTLPERISTIFTDVIARITEGSQSAYNAVIEWFSKIPERIAGFISDGIGKVLGLVDKVKNAFSSGAEAGASAGAKTIGQNYKGTNNWSGGLTSIHERGGEIIDLPSGSRVYPHDKSVSMARDQGRRDTGGGSGILIAKIADTIVVREEADIDRIADALVRKIGQAGINMG